MTVVPPLVFITGASSGIGEALAARYARAGWRLALVARRAGSVDDGLGARRFDGGDRTCVYTADVRDVDALAAAGRACIAAQGLPDVVIANAGISVGVDTAVRTDLDVMRATLETNLLGLAATFHPFIAPMRERRAGVLVGVCSVAGLRGLPGHGAYCASKAGAIAYCESLRGECRGSGIAVVTLLPGYVATPMTRRNRHAMPFLLTADDFAERAFRAIEARTGWRVVPWQMGIAAKLLRLLPNAAFDRLAAGQPRKRRAGE